MMAHIINPTDGNDLLPHDLNKNYRSHSHI